MTVVALCSAKGAPGVTTLACSLGAAWPVGRRVVVAECDPSGGDLAARFGLSPRRGMTSLVLSGRRPDRQGSEFSHHVQRLPGGLEVLPGSVSAEAAGALDRELARAASGLFPDDADVVFDCGRLRGDAPGQEAVLGTADDVLLLLRPDVAGVAHAFSARSRLDALSSSARTHLVIVGTGRFEVAEVSDAMGVRVAAVIPHDPGAAAMACGEPGKARPFARSPLVASARRLVADLLGQIEATAPLDMDLPA
jgi:MinD-like ATPase involved in chromosome partitioning or flagellar assembly